MFRVYPLKFGEVVEPEARIFYLGDCSKTIRLFNYFFLLEGAGGPILVDVGVSKPDADRFNPAMLQTAEDDPVARMREHGVEPSEVRRVIATHLHWDHFGPLVKLLPQATVFVQEAELAMVLDPPHPWFAKFTYDDIIRELVAEGRFCALNGDAEVMPGVSVMHTGGHTFGSQAVVVDTRAGRAVLTGDVCFTYRNLEEDRPGGFNSNLVECFSGLAKIRNAGQIIVPSHDPDVLRRHGGGIG